MCPARRNARRYAASVLRAWLDGWLYRRPFEGASARRYASAERPAFGDFDDRLVAALGAELGRAARVLELGSGPATFAHRVAAAAPAATVIALEPSRDLARSSPGLAVVRAVGEALPLAAASIDLVVCVSSIRHVRDRAAVFRELRRVLRPGGALVIAELDPTADAQRIANHADRLGSTVLRHAFGPLVVRTAPRAEAIGDIARAAGFRERSRRADPIQPFYVMELEVA